MKNTGKNMLFSTDEDLQKYYHTSYQLEKERFANIFGAVAEEPESNIDPESILFEQSQKKKVFDENTQRLRKYKKLVFILSVTTTLAVLATIFFALKFYNII
ncbi:MAG: hypothetical protein WCR54_02570 [Clostridia bacterium]